MPASRIISNLHFGIITPEKLVQVFPNLATWGVAAGSAVCLLGADVPIVRRDILSKVPIAGAYFALPAEDKEEN
ncbi:ubiquinol-cytochrome c reductase core subunit 10 QCR10 [Phycomyces blakesleeanus]|uniref:Ubiquinol-cytochrome c reductase core subunit 10 QCR10 n=2 Tax=Phycomyces blakesleeanus TaxID=4837 RepID=A0A162W815_PHYB8|nr:ubiquinol-cytochrome c reductase core subunit 10 QCR10 [Phycomyces blakesleeanus NRRL 1555(-)]OAD65245.1 ubiquinol-cytochrome c reductase core subunit 10 QCR10 [Phycomyces blakesleeanus NRRL 1555(-)]|eukprot:XP_018283285.1 ubiquinol-cytochrome c reductase core subunit 10 QCR10 [Phycomyces blakesleeanus NRRL 1555(-)]